MDSLEVRSCFRPERRGFCPPPGRSPAYADSGIVGPVQPFLACQAARILASFSGSIPVRMVC